MTCSRLRVFKVICDVLLAKSSCPREPAAAAVDAPSSVDELAALRVLADLPYVGPASAPRGASQGAKCANGRDLFTG